MTIRLDGVLFNRICLQVLYYSEYPGAIDERIRLHEEEADAAERRWREQSLTR